MKPNDPLQLLTTNIDFDGHKGRIAIGRVSAGEWLTPHAATPFIRKLGGRLRVAVCNAPLIVQRTKACVDFAHAFCVCSPPPGTIRKGQTVSICSSLEEGKVRSGKVNELFVYDNFNRIPVEEVAAGDICALTGIPDIAVSHACSSMPGRGHCLKQRPPRLQRALADSCPH